MKKYLLWGIVFFFVQGQIKIPLNPTLYEGVTIFERLNIHTYKKEKVFLESLSDEQIKPYYAMFYSFIFPGFGQYLQGDKTKAGIYLGLEILGWVLHSYYNELGKERTKVVEGYVNNINTGFSRVQYYQNIYKSVNGDANIPDIFRSSDNEEQIFQRILSDKKLYMNLKKWENIVGDGVHTLPATKTQQFYELVGKYRMFYHGWLGDEFISFKANEWKLIKHVPNHIVKYYEKRERMNRAFKYATWAISCIIINHVFSAVEAFITGKKRLKTSFQTRHYYGLYIPSFSFSYGF